MSIFKHRLKMAIKKPSKIPKAIIKRLERVYKLHIAEDEIAIAVNKWHRDNGDKTLRLNYALSNESLVFDLGGYVGDFAFQINQKYGCFVNLYEPVQKFYLECVHRFKNNPKIKCFNYGLSDRNGSFLIGDNEDGSSMIRNNASVNSKEIIVKSFLEEYNSLKISRVNLLKINIEGPEFLILPHIISNNIIQHIENIQVQFHDFYPNATALREEIQRNLSKTHIKNWDYPFVWESWSIRT
jgi:FkbM family methyltransferase